MPVVTFNPGCPVTTVDIPKEVPDGKDSKGKPKQRKLERSANGSLHVRPGTKVLTADELEWLEKHSPDVKRHMRVIADDEAVAKSKRKAEEGKSKAEADAKKAATKAAKEAKPREPSPAAQPEPQPAAPEQQSGGKGAKSKAKATS